MIALWKKHCENQNKQRLFENVAVLDARVLFPDSSLADHATEIDESTPKP